MKYIKLFERYNMEKLSTDVTNKKKVTFIKTNSSDIGTAMHHTILNKIKKIDPKNITILYDTGFEDFEQDLKLSPEKFDGYIIVDEFNGTEEDIKKIISTVHVNVQIVIIEKYASDLPIKESPIIKLIN